MIEEDGDLDGVEPPDDCDDADPFAYPGAEEKPYDGVDQDCDGVDLTDVDGDLHDGAPAGGDDCDDDDAGVSPSEDEVCANARDDDCDGVADEGCAVTARVDPGGIWWTCAHVPAPSVSWVLVLAFLLWRRR